MTYDIRCATEEEFEDWNRYVSRSKQSGPFHRRECLEALSRHTDTRLLPLMGFKGEQTIGLFPVFWETRGPFELVLSPPLQTVMHLGPVLLDTEQLKQRTLERRNRRFVRGCLDWIDRRFDADYVDVRTGDSYFDLRPFKGENYTVEPFYTYIVDISVEPDELLKRFSKDARRNIRKTDPSEYRLGIGDLDDATNVVQQINDRHGDELEGVNLNTGLVTDLYTELPDGAIKPYICYDHTGRMIGGTITIEYGDSICAVIGGASGNGDLPVNELIEWRIIEDGHENGYEYYDLRGANAEGLSMYKAKFAPDLAPYYHAMRVTPQARIALGVREKLKPIRQVGEETIPRIEALSDYFI